MDEGGCWCLTVVMDGSCKVEVMDDRDGLQWRRYERAGATRGQ